MHSPRIKLRRPEGLALLAMQELRRTGLRRCVEERALRKKFIGGSFE
jgi:hypothetical protein